MTENDLQQAVPHGKAPGDEERDKTTLMTVRREGRVVQHRINGDVSGETDEWIAAKADSAVAVVDRR
jgi:hypothetical protein